MPRHEGETSVWPKSRVEAALEPLVRLWEVAQDGFSDLRVRNSRAVLEPQTRRKIGWDVKREIMLVVYEKGPRAPGELMQVTILD